MGADDPTMLAGRPEWLAHRHDPLTDTIWYRRVTRGEHGKAVFLTDEYLGPAATVEKVDRQAALAANASPAPLHWIFHSAFCCSTLAARAFDMPGISMALKEPLILQDVVGWRRRGGEPREIARLLDNAGTLLAKPFEPGEAVIVKPSNILNPLAAAALALKPASRALLMVAPLETFLTSVAKKGMWCRLWARELVVGQLKDGVIDLGFTGEDYLRHTDLQCAAVGWLAQHKLFHDLCARFGPDRVKTIDSQLFLARPADALAAAMDLFGLAPGAQRLSETVAATFSRHSKWGEAYDRETRTREHDAVAAAHAEEIEKTAAWARAVADHAGIDLTLPAPLLD
ncbi:hypothetical protein [Sphingobium lignivorans]|uniref:Uncharacterized protein n=1 Tax=Sphingobium lignivorans TaxID=2735886 RepID=A0ABR6NAD4_9SPHN|nr:hypothetical protein [Sphingobium lignivorans]MBB5984235.1 hypothetical protein [Sphingobium lignivorans]